MQKSAEIRVIQPALQMRRKQERTRAEVMAALIEPAVGEAGAALCRPGHEETAAQTLERS